MGWTASTQEFASIVDSRLRGVSSHLRMDFYETTEAVEFSAQSRPGAEVARSTITHYFDSTSEENQMSW
jgi:hypothetical protein